MIGDIILKYRIESLLSSSLLGDIYTGIHIETKEKVIIRCINFQSTANIEVRLRIKNDLYLISQINHPSIAKVYDHSESGSNLFIISEFVEGKSLIKYREKYSNFFTHTIHEGFYADLLDIFSLVHSKSIVHGHIKPSNILITSDNKIKVINFGLSDFSEIRTDYSQKMNNNNLAIICYSSPEQIQKKSIDRKTDIYSLGVLLFFLLTGKNPYQSVLDEDELIKKIISEPFPLDVKNTEGLPEKYMAIIKKATEKNTEDRFLNCEQFKVAFNIPTQTVTVEKIQEKKTEAKPVIPVVVDKPKPVTVPPETPLSQQTIKQVPAGNPFNKNRYGTKKTSASIGLSIIIGVVIIVFGVLMALFVNTEKKTDTDNNYTKQGNPENMVDSILKKHEYLLDSINKSMDTAISDSVYVNVDQMPEFPGGKDNFTKWLKNNVHYPQTARKSNIKGNVIVSFVIDEKGRASDVEVVKDIGGGCGQEAEKLIERMPGWKPGRQNGKNVKMRYEVPVAFGPGQ